MNPHRTELRYEGKAKKVYATTDEGRYLVEFKDDATAFNARKRGTVEGKGAVNAGVSARIFEFLERAGIPTHFEKLVSPREQLVKAVTIVPLEVVVRNRAAGSFAQRYGVPEGGELEPIVIEWCLKDDELGDPPINDAAAVALGVVSPEVLEEMFELTTQINDLLVPYFAARGMDLVDFKLEFGTDQEGNVLLADEISPDTCRLWDLATGEKLDKDRFRRDLGRVEEAYQEVARRVAEAKGEDEDIIRRLADGDAHDHDYAPAVPDTATDPHGHTAERWRAQVDVMLRRSILDPQGRAVEATLHRLGHTNLTDVRIGKRIILEATGEHDELLGQLNELADGLLANPVMEDAAVSLKAEEG